MIVFIFRKFLYMLVVLLGVITSSFIVNYALPGDPARVMLGQRADEQSVIALRKELGLDRPKIVQYFDYIGKVFKGDLGKSFTTNRKIVETLQERFPATALLTISALLFSTILGIFIGVVAALYQGKFLDSGVMAIALFGISMPSFVLGLLYLLVFGVVLDILPISGYIDRGWNHLILPSMALALRPLSIIARVTRSSMIDTLSQDYIRTARAKGLSEFTTVARHALRNALNPVITTVSAWFAGLLAGSYFIEYIFNWPGIGMFTIDAILKLDYPAIQGSVLFAAIIFVLVNFIVDVLYAVVDPKVKLS
ncbi:MAG: ABC transporter permease [Candidatus Kapabacteria bacterium]|nr:ABC transporter permease [Candidatus Kapabacteria bacterium]